MPSVIARRAFPALLVTAGLAVAGCGSDSGGGNEDAYVKTYEASCKKIVDATKGLTSSASGIATSAGNDPEKAVGSLKSATIKLLDTFGSEFKTLSDAKAPDKFADFQDSVKDAGGKADDAIAKAKDEVSNIKSLQEFSSLDDKLDDIDFGDGKDLPKELAQKAPSCGTLDRGSSSSSSSSN